MNIIHMLGRLTIGPELKETPGGNKICRFRIAVPRNNEVSDFFNVTCWDKTAIFAADYFRKADRIIVHGAIRNNDYIDKNNVRHYAVEIAANTLEFADTKATKQENRAVYQSSEPEQNADFNAKNDEKDPAELKQGASEKDEENPF